MRQINPITPHAEPVLLGNPLIKAHIETSLD